MTSSFTPTVEQFYDWLQRHPPFVGEDLVSEMATHLGVGFHEFNFQKYYHGIEARSMTVAITWQGHYWYQNKPFPMTPEGIENLTKVVGKGYTQVTLIHDKPYDEAMTQDLLEHVRKNAHSTMPQLEEKRIVWRASFLANLEKMHLDSHLPAQTPSSKSVWRL